jgi:TonB family protein
MTHPNRGISLAVLLCGSGIAADALAQTGPLEPRMVLAAMPYPLPVSKIDGARVVLDLSVDERGKVTEVDEVAPSDDADFNERVRKYYSKVRFVPALADDGTPVAGKYKFVFKSTNGDKPDPGSSPPRLPDQPSSTTGTASGVTGMKVFDEVGRINRMHCKDFAWEYDLLKDIAGAKPVYDERMLKTVRAMYIVQQKVTAGQLSALNSQFSRVVRETLEDCRRRPDEPYFQSVFVPAMKTRLGH